MHTGLSPEWDRGFDEAFTDLVSHDDDLVRAEFTSLTRASWPQSMQAQTEQTQERDPRRE